MRGSWGSRIFRLTRRALVGIRGTGFCGSFGTFQLHTRLEGSRIGALIRNVPREERRFTFRCGGSGGDISAKYQTEPRKGREKGKRGAYIRNRADDCGASQRPKNFPLTGIELGRARGRACTPQRRDLIPQTFFPHFLRLCRLERLLSSGESGIQ